jgi:hypothetical protein
VEAVAGRNESIWHALAGCVEFLRITGGLHFVATVGYLLQPWRVAEFAHLKGVA